MEGQCFRLLSVCQRPDTMRSVAVPKLSARYPPMSLTHRIQPYKNALELAERQIAALIQRRPDFFPIYTVAGKWFHGGELWTDWTGGFLAGMMWQFHRRTGEDRKSVV